MSLSLSSFLVHVWYRISTEYMCTAKLLIYGRLLYTCNNVKWLLNLTVLMALLWEKDSRIMVIDFNKLLYSVFNLKPLDTMYMYYRQNNYCNFIIKMACCFLYHSTYNPLLFLFCLHVHQQLLLEISLDDIKIHV